MKVLKLVFLILFSNVTMYVIDLKIRCPNVALVEYNQLFVMTVPLTNTKWLKLKLANKERQRKRAIGP